MAEVRGVSRLELAAQALVATVQLTPLRLLLARLTPAQVVERAATLVGPLVALAALAVPVWSS